MTFDSLDKIEDPDYLKNKQVIYSFNRNNSFDLDTNELNGIKIVGGNILTQVCDNCLHLFHHDWCRKTFKSFFAPYLQAGTDDNWLFAKKVRAYYKSERVDFPADDHLNLFILAEKEYIDAKQKSQNCPDCTYREYWNKLNFV